MTDDSTPADRDTLAAEYALGVLDGQERLRAMALQRSDPAFARAVQEWEARLSPLLRDVDAVPPGDRLWSRISGRIEGSNDNFARAARRWRLATFATGAVAAALAVMVVTRPPAPPLPVPPVAATPGVQHVAQLVDPQGKPLMTIGYDTRARTMRVSAADLTAAGRVPELWVIPPGGKPRSLGALTEHGASRIVPPAQLDAIVRDGATLAVTLELRQGIPHAAPSGAIVASGTITSI